MTGENETIKALQEALKHSPENLPLLRHLAGLLMQAGDFETAEQTYRQALSLQPDEVDLKIHLAESFYHQEKHSAALVILEELAEQDLPSAQVLVMLARVKLAVNDKEAANRIYQEAKKLDPEVYDKSLAGQTAESGPLHEDHADSSRDQDAEPVDDELEISQIESAKVTFREVGGMEDLKEEIRMKIIHPIQHPDLYKVYGKSIGGGILLYGPPGCGKTYIARATAGEVNAGFLTVGIHDVLDLYLGESEKKLHNLFETARYNTPCVLFFDEVDALGAKRADMRSSSGRSLINQFLAELDGIGDSNAGILIMAATNAPWHLDPAFRRPGRFDRAIFVPPPDPIARAEILRLLLEDKPSGEINYEKLANTTRRFSGADLKAVVDVAVEMKLRDAIREGTLAKLTTRDLVQAADRLNPTIMEWFSTARNYVLYANESGQYDDLKDYLKL